MAATAASIAVAPNGQRMQINKTETEYNMKSIRFLLLTITTMFIAVGSLMIVLGISVYGHYHSFSTFYTDAMSGHFVTPSVMSVFVGLVLLVVSMFGFFGSLKNSTCMVNSYALFLILIFIVKLVVVILAFTLKPEQIIDYLDLPVTDYAKDAEIQVEIDSLQTSLGCCGSNSYLDYIDVQFTSNQSTVVISKQNAAGDLLTVVVPSTCCVTPGDVFCTRMWASGCKQALVDVLMQNSTIIGVLGVSVMFINLLGIIFAVLLARCIRKMKSERALIMWKIKEQFIIARAAEDAIKEPPQVFIQQQDSSTA